MRITAYALAQEGNILWMKVSGANKLTPRIYQTFEEAEKSRAGNFNHAKVVEITITA